MNTERQIRKGDRFEHARHLDTDWTPGPGETWADDAPHRVYRITRVASGNVWYGIGSHGAFTATVEQMTEGGFFVRRWLP